MENFIQSAFLSQDTHSCFSDAAKGYFPHGVKDLLTIFITRSINFFQLIMSVFLFLDYYYLILMLLLLLIIIIINITTLFISHNQ